MSVGRSISAAAVSDDPRGWEPLEALPVFANPNAKALPVYTAKRGRSAGHGVGSSHGRGEELAGERPRNLPKHLVETYEIDIKLGEGAFSTVYKCIHRKSGEVRAVKRIDTNQHSPRDIAREIALMRLLKHDNVVRCYEIFLEAQFVNIVVDMFTGGDLIDGLNAHREARGRIPDAQLAHISRQMVAALVHVHSLQIVHRDIKGENFLLDRPDIGSPECKIALADFGTATRVEPGETLSDRVGTPGFWAPEIFNGSYDFRVDIWAMGITTFILVAGALPFEGEDAICRSIPQGESAFPVPYHATRGCLDFISACLAKDPWTRPPAADLAQHAWMSTPPLSRRGLMECSEVCHSSWVCLGALLEGLGAVAVGCCDGALFCVDLFLTDASQIKKQKTLGAEPSASSSAAGAAATLEGVAAASARVGEGPLGEVAPMVDRV